METNTTTETTITVTRVTTETSTVRYRDIEGFEGYRVGSDGTVWSCWERAKGKGSGRKWVMGSEWRQCKLTPFNNGYMSVTLCRNGEPKRCTVHSIVLSAFRGERPSGLEARHLDGNRQNNHLTNLAWGTNAENVADKLRHGTTGKGERNGRAKLNEAKALAALDRIAAGESKSAVARDLGIGWTTLDHLASGRSWRHLPRPASLQR